MISTKKKLIAAGLLALTTFSGTIFFSQNKKAEASESKFIYIDTLNYKLHYMEGDVNYPNMAKDILEPMDIAGPREYFRYEKIDGVVTEVCPVHPSDHSSTEQCLNRKEALKPSSIIYHIDKRIGKLHQAGNVVWSEPIPAYSSTVCNDTEDLNMLFPLLVKDFYSVNIHSYNDCSPFDPEILNYGTDAQKAAYGTLYKDGWGEFLPKGQYTHGCWALKLEDAKKLYNTVDDNSALIFRKGVPGTSYTQTPEKSRDIPRQAPVNEPMAAPVVTNSPTVAPIKPTVESAPINVPTKAPAVAPSTISTPTPALDPEALDGDIKNRCKADASLYAKNYEILTINRDINTFFKISHQEKYAGSRVTEAQVKKDLVAMNYLHTPKDKENQLWARWNVCIPIY